ncbi:MAG TPA: oligosaccharide flippase family protein [Streptosporangiaceae bacterium]
MREADPPAALATPDAQAPSRDTAAASGERPSADLGSLARGGAISLVGAACSGAAGVGLVALVTRGFNKAEAGVFFAASSLFLLSASIAKLGADTGLVYFISRLRVLGRRAEVRRVVVVALVPVALAGVLAGALLFAGGPWLAGRAVDGPPGHFTGYVRTLACFLPLAALSDALLAATRGFRTQRPTALIEGIGRPLGQIVLVALAVATASAAWLGFAWGFPYLGAALLAWLALRIRLPRHDQRTDPVPSEATPGGGREPSDGSAGRWREFWGYTWPRTFAGIAQLAIQRLDILLVAALRGPADAAVYTAATRFLVVGQLGGNAISTAVQPQLGERLALADTAGARTLYRTATAWLMLLVWPLYLTCAVFAGPMMALFGRGYAAGTTVVLVLTGAMLVATGCGMVDMVLSMSGRTSWNLMNVLLALAVNVGLDLVLIPHLGITGAAIGWAAAIVVNNLVPLAQVGLVLKLHPFGTATLTAAALAGACFGAVPFGLRAVAGDGLLPLIAATAAGAVLYAGGCWRLRHRLELTSLRALAVRRGRVTDI